MKIECHSFFILLHLILFGLDSYFVVLSLFLREVLVCLPLTSPISHIVFSFFLF